MATSAAPQGQYIEIERKDGRTEILTDLGPDAEEFWEGLEGDATISLRAWYVPKRSGDGHRCRGIWGERIAERNARQDVEQAEQARRSQEAVDRMIAGRDWTWTAPSRGFGAGC